MAKVKGMQELWQEAIDVWWGCGRSYVRAAEVLAGTSKKTIQARVARAKELGMEPRTEQGELIAAAPASKTKPRYRKVAGSIRENKHKYKDITVEIPSLIRRKPATAFELAGKLGVSQQEVEDALSSLTSAGVAIQCLGGVWQYSVPQSSYLNGAVFEFVSQPDNTFIFGVTSDNHLGSKYERLDVLEDLYDRFAAAEVQAVMNAGNWIDGEARFNKHDLHVHGMDAQLRYLADKYPRREGIKTYAVAGDDHEGWVAQREGVDIGRYAEMRMRDAGRDDWYDLGYMEAHIVLRNANTGASAIMAVVHPGGGSAYALSYSIQKIIESLESGEKPAVGIYGHYHKLWAGNIRNVWCIQSGCTQDQSPFMRKKRLEAHVGGAIIRLEQDPNTGAIIGFTPELIRYFNRGYYNNRWSHSGPVDLPERQP